MNLMNKQKKKICKESSIKFSVYIHSPSDWLFESFNQQVNIFKISKKKKLKIEINLINFWKKKLINTPL